MVPRTKINSGAVVESSLSPRNVSATSEHNEWNPRFSPDGRYLSFERRDETAQAIFILDMEAPDAPPERVSSMPPEPSTSLEDMVLGIGRADESFNTQLSFFPDGSRFVFTGNESSGVYRLYEGSVGGSPPKALTSESKEDGHPAVSPTGNGSPTSPLVRVWASSTFGISPRGVETPLTAGPEIDLFPVWSPDSRGAGLHLGRQRQPRCVHPSRRDPARSRARAIDDVELRRPPAHVLRRRKLHCLLLELQPRRRRQDLVHRRRARGWLRPGEGRRPHRACGGGERGERPGDGSRLAAPRKSHRLRPQLEKGVQPHLRRRYRDRGRKAYPHRHSDEPRRYLFETGCSGFSGSDRDLGRHFRRAFG